ncbi:major facilitator superfamily domain-containing protein 12-like [Periplaneta americana]|uniref:major facilitator superfamily domain-containing protein 12-like n=1 Tax=Periplaneta americana TaxID=6978 RepID=UPI0037E8AFE2
MEEVKVSNLSISEPNEEHTPLTGSMERSTSTIYRREHHLPLSLRAAYGLGHIFNDISAAMWFSYTLLFLQMVLGMHPTLAGTMLLIGQLADGFATPIVGYMSDRVGSRKAWHITGSILVLVSFPLIFAPCPGCSNSASSSPTWLMAVYYAALIIVFQGAWAVVQISHLAMIPDLTPTQHGRAELTAIRYTASVCSSVAVYIITWCVFHATKGTGLDKIGPDDAFKFRDVVIIGIVIGIITNSLFHIGLRKVNTQAMQSLIIEHDVPETRRILSYFHSPTLFQVAFLYVTSRLFLTISLVYMPLYLNESLNKGTELIATVPLVCYLSSFTASIGIKYFNNYYGSKLSYLFGAIISISGCLWLRFGMIPQLLTFSIYGVAVFLGAGSSITMVTSLCITADLIGTHTENGAFVYGIVTFADKMLNGIAVMIIENMKCATSGLCPHYYRDILVYVCGSSAVLGLIVLLSLSFVNIGNRRRAGSDILGRSFSTSDTVQSDAQLFCNLPNGIKRSL